MKQIKNSNVLVSIRQKFGTSLLATGAALAVAGIAASALLAGSNASGEPEDGWKDNVHALAQVAELNQLLADYHGALAYGGNLSAMASLFTDDAVLTLNNGTPYMGKDAVLGFFANGPYFHHNWVSLAPEWKTTITVHGDSAEVTTECIATDVSVTPNVIRGVIQVNATCERRGGKWFFTRMNNFSLPQL
jgi:hypothetical protein